MCNLTLRGWWQVDDRSTKVLIEILYVYLERGLTVPRALRLAMLHLVGRRPAHAGEEEREGWEAVERDPRTSWYLNGSYQPVHWAGFVALGASTRLPL